jgi:hypothetical protein
MTAQQIQTIGNALAADLVAWGTAAIGLALVAAGSRLGVAAAALSAGPALVGEAVVALFGEDEMIEQGNAEQFSRLAQPFGQDAIFGARRDVTRGVIVGTNPGAGIHQDQRFEDFAWMDNGQIERASGDDIDADETMFRIQATDQELFPVQTGKQRPEDGRSAFRRMDRFRSRNGTALTHERDAVPRDTVFPNRAQWPSTVRGTERAINGHVRLLLKLCSSPTLHKPRVGRNEGGGTGLSQRAGLEGRRPARRGPGRPVRCSPAPGRTHWGLTLRPKPDGTEAFQ